MNATENKQQDEYDPRFAAGVFAPSFRVALTRSRMLRDAAAVLGAAQTKELWDQLTIGEDGESDLAWAVYVTMPEDDAPLVRRASGIPAAYFVKKLAEQLEDPNLDKSDEVAVRFACAEAWRRLEDRKRAAHDIERGFGWDLSESWETIVEAEEGKWAEDLIRAIARLAGSMYDVMKGTRRRVPDAAPQEVKEVTLGGDVERLLPAEHAQLSSDVEALSASATMRLIQKKSQQLRVAGDKPQGRGPLAIAIDESGSMDPSVYYGRQGNSGHGLSSSSRNVWAKSCASALMRLAHEENRTCVVVHFADSCVPRTCKPGDRQAVLSALCHFMNGGTTIGKALRTGFEQTKELAAQGETGADVVMITDGLDGNPHAINDAIDLISKAKVKLWTVAIECILEPTNSLRSRAEQYVQVTGNEDAEVTKSLAQAAMGEKVR